MTTASAVTVAGGMARARVAAIAVMVAVATAAAAAAATVRAARIKRNFADRFGAVGSVERHKGSGGIF